MGLQTLSLLLFIKSNLFSQVDFMGRICFLLRGPEIRESEISGLYYHLIRMHPRPYFHVARFFRNNVASTVLFEFTAPLITR